MRPLCECFLHLALAAFLASSAVGSAVAQVQPTAEQMQMINQLPPAQRRQALDAIRQMQSQGAAGTQESDSSEEQLFRGPGETMSGDLLDPEDSGVPKALGGSTLIVNLTALETLNTTQLNKLENDPALAGISGSHHFKLDEFGILELPGLPRISLLGLDEVAIAQRLGAEPSLKDFSVLVTLLRIESVGAEALEPFGYDVFESEEYGFQPVTTGPVPPDYILGPGDSIRVQLFGNVNGIYEFEVSRDGVLNLPEIGPITVAGLPFSEFRTDLRNRVREMLIGTQVSVSMGMLRTINVFVLGDVNRPGSYVLSSMSTISSALYQSGGISEIGTLRNIQLKRQGRMVTTLDLYDLLLKGDTSGDVRLQQPT